MSSRSAGIGRAVKRVVLALCLMVAAALYFHPLYAGVLPLVTPWTAAAVRHRVGLVHAGMTEAQVWAALGLSGRGLRARVSGSGPSREFPANYVLWPGTVLQAGWNLRTRPATLVKLEVRDRL